MADTRLGFGEQGATKGVGHVARRRRMTGRDFAKGPSQVLTNEGGLFGQRGEQGGKLAGGSDIAEGDGDIAEELAAVETTECGATNKLAKLGRAEAEQRQQGWLAVAGTRGKPGIAAALRGG